MKVEIYRNDTDCEPADAQAEALALIEELNLMGQKVLVSGEGRDPWTAVTQEQLFVLRNLCPARTPLEAYDSDAIPLRVLSLVREVRPRFHRLEVWHPAKANLPDPFLVGVKTDAWNAPLFLLARWGTELDEWPALERRAMELWVERRRSELHQIAAQVRATIESLESTTLSVAAGLQATPIFYN